MMTTASHVPIDPLHLSVKDLTGFGMFGTKKPWEKSMGTGKK
jgi:hypothetical protein